MLLNENYKTTDFCLATTLNQLGFSIVKLEKINFKQFAFCFEPSPQLQNTLQLYLSEKITVKPQDFCLTQRKLKALIYEGSLYAP